MPKHTVTVTQTKVYEVEVEAEDPASAIEALNDWLEEDFQEFKIDGHWEFEAI